MDMHYDKGMVPPVGQTGHGTAGSGKHSNSGEKQATRGASVRSGLSHQKGFHDEGNHKTGHCTRGKNQVPIHPKHKVDTDRGGFTCY